METTEVVNIYELMCIILYSYRNGHLTFIELLEKLEEIAADSQETEEQSHNPSLRSD